VCGAWLGSGWGCRATTVWSRMMMLFWNFASVAVHATLTRIPKRRRHHGVPRVLHRLLRHFELAGRFCQGVESFSKATVNGPIAPEADRTRGVKMALFPASFVIF
jgi:hypothetical protein